MSYSSPNVLILLPVSNSSKAMKPGKLIFWIVTAIVILQAVAPINGVNSKLNHNYVFHIRLDYLIHTVMFLVLSVLFRLAYFPQSRFIASNEILFIGVMLITAFSSEAVQWLVPYRVFNINDLIANTTGIILSIPLFWQGRNFIKKKYLPSRLNS